MLLENRQHTLPLLEEHQDAGRHRRARQRLGYRPLVHGRPSGILSEAVSVLAGIQHAVSNGTKVIYGTDASVARDADAIVLVLGETSDMSGEASSRAFLDLPGDQEALAEAVIAAGKPVAVVLLNGRPLSVGWLHEHAPAMIDAWFLGSEMGNAVADVLFGDYNPGGKLPVTFPRTVGQVPIYYDHLPTGRPPDPNEHYTSKYIDEPWTPLYPFGYGLSYTTFGYDAIMTQVEEQRQPTRISRCHEYRRPRWRRDGAVLHAYPGRARQSTRQSATRVPAHPGSRQANTAR